MIEPEQKHLEQRVLILAPTGKDASLTAAAVSNAGIYCAVCVNLENLAEEIGAGAGAIILAEEVLAEGGGLPLARVLAAQPVWSDMPVLILTRPGADSATVAQSVQAFGNVTLLERPTRIAALLSAVQTALRARARQYQIRSYIAEEKRAHETRALLAAIVESSDDAIISKTLEGIITSWNSGAERLFEYTANEAIGCSITLIIPPERLDEETHILQQMRLGRRIDHFETVRMSKSGRRLNISLTVSPMFDADGKVFGASKVARDITARKRADEALRQADRRKDEFLAMLAHELRNPLAPICNSLHILRLTGCNDPATERVAEMMERQVTHMVRLVDDLLEVSRITRGKIVLRKEAIELAAVVRNAVETSRPLIEANHQQLAIALPAEPVSLHADAVRLTQVLTNLLNNAAKYTDPGGQIWLNARRQGEQVIVSVRDTGVGIEPEKLGHVFELFMQVDRSAARAQGGLGIGLTLAKTLVEMHGGTIEAHSAGPGKGSEFICRLPIAEQQPLAGRPANIEESPAPLLAPRRILVTDDNRDAADSLVALLKFLGAHARAVYSGSEALAAIKEFRPGVVLLDIGMPGMDGCEVARRIRDQPELQDVTLIALTGWGQEADRQSTKAAGFDYHLMKPADIGALEAVLTSLDGAD